MRGFKKGQHQILKVSKYLFQRLILDFITGLFEIDDPVIGKNYNIIMTIVDGLTKYVKFILYRTDIDIR